MTYDQWMQAYFAEFVECCDCNCYVALGAAEEAERMQRDLYGSNTARWDDPALAVQDELASWEDG